MTKNATIDSLPIIAATNELVATNMLMVEWLVKAQQQLSLQQRLIDQKDQQLSVQQQQISAQQQEIEKLKEERDKLKNRDSKTRCTNGLPKVETR